MQRNADGEEEDDGRLTASDAKTRLLNQAPPAKSSFIG
jgi:hypothetical protein